MFGSLVKSLLGNCFRPKSMIISMLTKEFLFVYGGNDKWICVDVHR